MSSETQQVKLQILGAALELLKEVGAEGLSMRKVATGAGMSLGNLQYHYKNRTALLNALATFYFDECSRLLVDYRHRPASGSPEQKLEQFVLFLLKQTDGISDMCRVFREIWSVATRDQAISDSLTAYYATLLQQVAETLETAGFSKTDSQKIASLLLPFVEGYSITADALPVSNRQLADMLTRSVSSILAQGNY